MPPAAQIEDIFLGVTPSAARNFLRSTLRGIKNNPKYTRAVFPCCGRFGAVEAAIAAEVPAERIEASDIALFSCILGHLGSRGHLRELGIHFASERFERLNAYIGKREEAGAVFTAMKIAQLNGDKIYTRVIIDELWRGLDDYVMQLSGKAWELAGKIRGLRFDARDMIEHIRSVADDPGTIICLNPPLFQGGYQRMWRMVGTEIIWNAPNVPYFDPKTQLDKLFDILLSAKALTLFYRPANQAGGLDEKLRDYGVFASSAHRKTEFVCSNRPDEVEKLVQQQRETKVAPARIPVLPPDHVITENSTAGIVKTTAAQALYYRDLWAHKLGTTRSEGYYFVAVDGYIFGVFGMRYDQWLRGESSAVHEVFGFNVPSKRYPRLNRLLMAIIMSEDARKFYLSEFSGIALNDLDYFKTTCIATVPE